MQGARGTLVVVGAGPIGMVGALLLRDRFERVVVVERQPERQFVSADGFAFPIVFSPAAIGVLRRVGAWDAIRSERSPYFGVVASASVLGRDLGWTVRRPDVHAHWRSHIIRSLYDSVRVAGIDVVFDARPTDIDFGRSTCTIEGQGSVSFDLLLGADGSNSRTRAWMADGHPDHEAGAFEALPMDAWYAYRLPCIGPVATRFGAGPDGVASRVYATNVPGFRRHKLRVITTAMAAPNPEISVLLKHDRALDAALVRTINQSFFSGLVDPDTLARAWDEGASGTFRHVRVPTFRRGRTLLVGDAAHGFESTGDLINVGLTALGSLPAILDRHQHVEAALSDYDATVGAAARAYSDHALRRSRETIGFGLEVAGIELGAALGLIGHHPSFWGIYEEDFDLVPYMERYEGIRRRLGGTAAATMAIAVLAAGARATTRRTANTDREPTADA